MSDQVIPVGVAGQDEEALWLRYRHNETGYPVRAKQMGPGGGLLVSERGDERGEKGDYWVKRQALGKIIIPKAKFEADYELEEG